VYPVNRAPEGGPAALQLGAVVTEEIGDVGDVDEFTFTAAAGQEMYLLAQLRSAMSSDLGVELVRGTEVVTRMEMSSPHATPDDNGSGRLVLEGGEYTVRAYGRAAGGPGGATGSYRLELYPVDRLPENGARLGLDTPPADGAIDRPGDVDELAFPATAGQHVVIHLEVPSPTIAGPLHAELVSPSGTVLSEAVNYSQDPSFGNHYSARVLLGATGTYRLRVSGGVPWSFARGAYRVEAYTVNPAPEHVPALVQLGQTVTGERIDRPGDLDLFTFMGQPGSEAELFLGASEALGVPASVRKATESFTFLYTSAGGAALDSISTGRFPMSSGAYEVAVNVVLGSAGTGLTGAYAFRVHLVNRAPEGRAASYTLGDTVSAEPLYPSGDVDEYLFELAAPARLRVFWSISPATSPDDAVTGRLISVVTGQVLWHSSNAGPPPTADLPAGRYRFEVMNPNYHAPVAGGIFTHYPTLRYRFAVTR
jgi:hypothetical protein